MNQVVKQGSEGRSFQVSVAVMMLALALVAIGCGGGADGGEAGGGSEAAGAEGAPSPPPMPDSSGQGARTLPVPGTLPEGHPPLGDATLPAPGVPVGALDWDVPAEWTVEPPSSSMRRAQYRVPGPGGDGECVVFYFGPGQGGDPMANAERWAGQFTQPDGRSSLDVMQTREIAGTVGSILLVEVSGTYSGGMTGTMEPAEEKPGYMLLAAIAPGPDAPWFFKFTGPAETVRSQRAAFESMLRSIRLAA